MLLAFVRVKAGKIILFCLYLKFCPSICPGFQFKIKIALTIPVACIALLDFTLHHPTPLGGPVD